MNTELDIQLLPNYKNNAPPPTNCPRLTAFTQQTWDDHVRNKPLDCLNEAPNLHKALANKETIKSSYSNEIITRVV